MGLSVAQVMLSDGFGGAERLFVDLCLALADRGCRVLAICQPTFQGRGMLAEDDRVEIADLRVQGNWDLFAARRMQNRLRTFGADVVHSHLARGALYAGRCGRALSMPVAANLHNYVDLKYYRRVDAFLPGTEDQARYLVERDVDPGRIHVVPHFTRLASADGPRADGATFIAYGRMVAKKGFDLLLRAFARLHERSTDSRLLLGGDGPERLALERLADRLGLDRAVEFVGWVDDAGAFLDRGDVFVLPSHDEPFGIVVLEAMARGKAIVATRTAGPVEVLDESVARLVGIGDEAALSRAMASLIEDPVLRQRLAERSLARFRERFSEERVLPRFIGIYRSLLTGTPLQDSGTPAG